MVRGIAFIWKCNWHVAFILIVLDQKNKITKSMACSIATTSPFIPRNYYYFVLHLL